MRPFFMISTPARVRLVQAGAVLAAAALVAGCGNAYRPVVTPINPSGPAAQPTAYVVVVSAPSPSSAGIVTLVDYAGDTVLTIAPIGPGPSTFTLDELGATGYTLNSDGTLSNFPITTSLQAKEVTYSTLAASASPVNLMGPSAGLWVPDLTGNVVDLFASNPEAFKLAIPVTTSPPGLRRSPSSAAPPCRASANMQSARTSVIQPALACNTARRPRRPSEFCDADREISTNSDGFADFAWQVPGLRPQQRRPESVSSFSIAATTPSRSSTRRTTPSTPAYRTSTRAARPVNCHPVLPLSTHCGCEHDQ